MQSICFAERESSAPVGMSFSIADNAVRFASASAKNLGGLPGSVALRIKRTSWGSIRTRMNGDRFPRERSMPVLRGRANQSQKLKIGKFGMPKRENDLFVFPCSQRYFKMIIAHGEAFGRSGDP